MKNFLLVFFGGGLGSGIRYLIGKYSTTYTANFPYSTFTVNILGSLIIGLILGYALKNETISSNTTLFLATGFCGGFTTFSAFTYENFGFLKSGDYILFGMYTLGSLILGILAVFLGMWLIKLI